MTGVQKLTDIDLSDLQMGEKLTIYRGSGAFVSGPYAAGYVGDATVEEVTRRSAVLMLVTPEGSRFQSFRRYRLRLKDARICRIPNGETTALYVHARGGRPTVTAYFTDGEYALVKLLLAAEVKTPGTTRSYRLACRALERMDFHDALRSR